MSEANDASGLDAPQTTRHVLAEVSAVRSSAAALERLEAQVRTLAGTVALAARREADAIAGLRQLCERLAERHRDVEALIGRIDRIRYHWMVRRIQRVIDRLTPRGATLAVVSHGDHQLTSVAGRQGWHLPEPEVGTNVAGDPADSAAAIAQVERLHRRGARYLVIPSTALWWLDRYRGLDAHLRQSATCVFHDARIGALFALGTALGHP